MCVCTGNEFPWTRYQYRKSKQFSVKYLLQDRNAVRRNHDEYYIGDDDLQIKS